MARYTRTRLDHLYKNEVTALAALNKNFEDIESAILDTVSRSGQTPSHMTKELDMNGQRIINLPAPVGDNDIVRKIDVQSTLTQMLNLYTSANGLVSAATDASVLAIQKAGEAIDKANEASISAANAKQYADSLDTHQIVHTYEVVNNLNSDATTFPLSAKQGKILQDQVNTMKARGTFLSTWNCLTGLANTSPQVVPRQYVTGDYFIVYQTGSTNYRPTGSYYDPSVPSTVVETEVVDPNDTYVYDGESWSLIKTPRDYYTQTEINTLLTNKTQLVDEFPQQYEQGVLYMKADD